ncbi:MAG: PQQ-binding-like beta-propeller repeat protein, partial [Planctomycetaceae bacterium]
MWRYGPQRGAVTPQELPDDLKPSWTRQLPVPLTAWPATQPRLQFDEVPQPVVVGQRVFVPCTVTDSVSAFSTRSGERLWRFQTDGPVRFAPVAHAGHLYCVSDDGYLYCLDATDGSLQWKINGGPADRRVLGHGRLVSSWPARGGVLLHDERLFFAASIWPFMGVFLHAVDPLTGQVLWTNSGDGTNYTTQPHGTPSFATVAPQGHLAAIGDALIVPGGRSVPAVFDTGTGRFRHFEYYNKGHGGHAVMVGQQAYFVGGKGYDLRDGMLAKTEIPTFCGPRQVVFIDGKTVRIAAAASQMVEDPKIDRVGKKKPGPVQVVYADLATHTLAPAKKRVPQKWLFRASRQLWGLSGTSTVMRYDLPRSGQTKNRPIKPTWQTQVEGTVVSALAADDRLFVVTSDAQLHCFAPGVARDLQHPRVVQPWKRSPNEGDWRRMLDVILDHEPRLHGIAVCLGVRDGGLIRQLLSRTQLSVIAVDPDPDVIHQLRARLVAAGWYGHRASAHVGIPADFALPPYLARLVISERSRFGPEDISQVFSSLRPYGGAAYLKIDQVQLDRLARDLDAPQARVSSVRNLSVLRRVGPLPGAGEWTHQYGNGAQTGVSQDRLVKAPLGLLWFGGLSHEGVLPRHGHGPAPQVAGGRLVIEGADFLRCVDVYTGRLLWQKNLPQLGAYHNVTAHFSGASEVGSNYVTTAERVYVIYGTQLLELDAETGETLFDFSRLNTSELGSRDWGFLAVHDKLLVATTAPVSIRLIRPNPIELTLILLPEAGWPIQLQNVCRHVGGAIPEVASAGTALKSKWSQRFPISRFVDWSPFQVLLRDAAYFQSRLASLLGPPNNTAEVPPAA